MKMLNHHSFGKVGSPIRGICTHFQKLFPPVLMFQSRRQNVIIGHWASLCWCFKAIRRQNVIIGHWASLCCVDVLEPGGKMSLLDTNRSFACWLQTDTFSASALHSFCCWSLTRSCLAFRALRWKSFFYYCERFALNKPTLHQDISLSPNLQILHRVLALGLPICWGNS